MHKYKLRQVPRFFGTNWCAIVVPIQVIRWYRQCYNGTDSCAIVVQIRRYCHYRLSCLQRCISFESYIKPQRNRHIEKTFLLYIFWILHQTTTCPYNPTSGCRCISFESYIKPQLQRRFTIIWKSCISFESYIKPQHKNGIDCKSGSCISFESYIKPQPLAGKTAQTLVVYLLNPTSNHNQSPFLSYSFALYIFWILHQTTTAIRSHVIEELLYIFWILHQTTTYRFESTDFQHITITFSNKKWWVGYNFRLFANFGAHSAKA